MSNSQYSANKGLTIIELLVTIIVAGMIMTAAISLHIHNHKIYSKEECLIEARDHTRGALSVLVEEIRLAGYNPTEAVYPIFDPPVRYGDTDSVIIRMDLDSNGVCDAGEERIYFFSPQNNTIYRALMPTADTFVIARNIDYLEFRYFKEDGTELTRPVDIPQADSIRAIKIIIVGKTRKEFGGYHESGTYPNGSSYDDRYYRCWDSTFVRLRNL